MPLQGGKQVASVAEDGAFGVWDTATGKLLRMPRGHEPGLKMYYGVAASGTKVRAWRACGSERVRVSECVRECV